MEVEVKSKAEKKEYGKFDKYDIESAVRTLKEAEEIKMDKEKMVYVEKCMKKGMEASKRAYKSIADMRADYKAMPSEDDDEY